MDDFKSFQQKVQHIRNYPFEEVAIELFRYQARNNLTYTKYLKNLGKDPEKIKAVEQIPFLPIEFFKNQRVITGQWSTELYFKSSGTTGLSTSTHFIRDLEFYLIHSQNIFEQLFGPLENYRILALLPSYLERPHSSLIVMLKSFMDRSAEGSGFYLNDYEELIKNLRLKDKKTILWGVSFAVLELAERYPMDIRDVTIIETGGMKGRREELTRNELYEIIRSRLKVTNIHAEYGMTELLSQVYGINGRFKASDSMHILIRDINDPFQYVNTGRTGGINIVDLANIHSCAFIETKDLGRANPDGTFEVLGRFDNSDLRGCNLMF